MTPGSIRVDRIHVTWPFPRELIFAFSANQDPLAVRGFAQKAIRTPFLAQFLRRIGSSPEKRCAKRNRDGQAPDLHAIEASRSGWYWAPAPGSWSGTSTSARRMARIDPKPDACAICLRSCVLLSVADA